jgi:hypothetical protein
LIPVLQVHTCHYAVRSVLKTDLHHHESMEFLCQEDIMITFSLEVESSGLELEENKNVALVQPRKRFALERRLARQCDSDSRAKKTGRNRGELRQTIRQLLK